MCISTDLNRPITDLDPLMEEVCVYIYRFIPTNHRSQSTHGGGICISTDLNRPITDLNPLMEERCIDTRLSVLYLQTLL